MVLVLQLSAGSRTDSDGSNQRIEDRLPRKVAGALEAWRSRLPHRHPWRNGAATTAAAAARNSRNSWMPNPWMVLRLRLRLRKRPERRSRSELRGRVPVRVPAGRVDGLLLVRVAAVVVRVAPDRLERRPGTPGHERLVLRPTRPQKPEDAAAGRVHQRHAFRCNHRRPADADGRTLPKVPRVE